MLLLGVHGDVPRFVLLGGAPRPGKGSAARRLPRARPRWCRTEIHAMTEIDSRDYYIQNTPETLCRRGLDAQRAIWPAIESIA